MQVNKMEKCGVTTWAALMAGCVWLITMNPSYAGSIGVAYSTLKMQDSREALGSPMVTMAERRLGSANRAITRLKRLRGSQATPPAENPPTARSKCHSGSAMVQAQRAAHLRGNPGSREVKIMVGENQEPGFDSPAGRCLIGGVAPQSRPPAKIESREWRELATPKRVIRGCRIGSGPRLQDDGFESLLTTKTNGMPSLHPSVTRDLHGLSVDNASTVSRCCSSMASPKNTSGGWPGRPATK